VPSFAHFKEAQDDPSTGFRTALQELHTGRKRSHWIWYIFPQLAGLGSSSQSRRYGLEGLDDAVAYVQDPVLGPRLLEATTAVAEQIRRGVTVQALMGSSIDVLKLVSSLTLFEAAAARRHERDGSEASGTLASLADEVLMTAFAEGYPRCQTTLAKLRG
jgi:uncharacterized protein (DUF1810 family)